MRRLALVLATLAACSDDVSGIRPDAPAGSDPDGGVAPGEDGGGGSNGDDGGVTTTLVPSGCVASRSTSDRADDTTRDQIRVLYVLPSDRTDRQYDTNGKICNSARAFATFFYNQTGSGLRFDTSGGLIDVGFVRLTKTDAQMKGNDPNQGSVDFGTAYVLNRIERELRAMGLVKNNKLYAVYYDGSSSYACGGGAYPPTIPGRLGAMYLNGLPLGAADYCDKTFPWGQASLVPNYIDYGMLHELVHAFGLAPESSPNEHTVGHVYDLGATSPNRDLMYSPRPGQPDPGWATTNPAGLIIDINNNDYYSAPAAAVDLSEMSFLEPLPPNAMRPAGW